MPGRNSSVSFRVKTHHNESNQNNRILSDMLRTNKTNSLKPVPPNRTSSLQYRNRTLHPSASLYIYRKQNFNNHDPSNSNSSSSDADADDSSLAAINDNVSTIASIQNFNSCNMEDQGSIYSSFSLRMSRLSSFNLGSANQYGKF
jgi:hypothetical protein